MADPMQSVNAGVGATNGGFNWGSLGTGLGDLFSAWNGSQQNYNNPSSAAMPYMNQIPGTASPYYQPYINAGQQAMGQLQGQYGQLISNPGQFMNQMGQSFQQSPGYQFQVGQATNAANRASAAGGMLGSPAEQSQLAGTVNGLANQDYYNWLNHAQNLYGMGLQGLQGINQMGYNASDSLANLLSQNLQNEGNFAYAGAANQNQYNQGQAGNMSTMITNGLGSLGTAISSFL